MGRSMQTVGKLYREIEEHTKTIGLKTDGMETKVCSNQEGI
jgi:hypothetical protein